MQGTPDDGFEHRGGRRRAGDSGGAEEAVPQGRTPIAIARRDGEEEKGGRARRAGVRCARDPRIRVGVVVVIGGGGGV